MIDVTAMGELLIDFACREVDAAGYPTMKANPGGAPGNLLAALNRYGCKTAFLGKVGSDAFGHMLVETMKKAYGTDPEHIRAAVGAGIGQCCFETHDDVPEAMLAALGDEAKPFIKAAGEKWQVDLKGLNHRWLTLAGVPEEQIDVCELCTACHPELYWSHRKMGDARGVQGAAIMKV